MSIEAIDDTHLDDDHFLLPGDWYFGMGGSIRTLLGSCVAVTFWHPLLHLGGMCHFVLPTSGKKRGATLDGRYGDEAIEALLQSAQRATPRLLEYRIGLYGGGRMFAVAGRDDAHDIGQRNIEAARQLLARVNLPICATHCGGSGHRNICLDLDSGIVAVRHGELTSGKEQR